MSMDWIDAMDLQHAKLAEALARAAAHPGVSKRISKAIGNAIAWGGWLAAGGDPSAKPTIEEVMDAIATSEEEEVTDGDKVASDLLLAIAHLQRNAAQLASHPATPADVRRDLKRVLDICGSLN
jgi:hypothetical protein